MLKNANKIQVHLSTHVLASHTQASSEDEQHDDSGESPREVIAPGETKLPEISARSENTHRAPCGHGGLPGLSQSTENSLVYKRVVTTTV